MAQKCWVLSVVLLPLLSPFLIVFAFCMPPLYDQNWNIHLLPGTPLHQRICPNLKELKENVLPYATTEFMWAFVAVSMKVC
jgi:hypothetical protein